MMLRLVYISSMCSPLSAGEVDVLVQRAAWNNRHRGLTGMLLYNGKEFVQCLEGELEQVSALYGRILMDHHHHDVRVLQAVPMAARWFSGWPMHAFCVGDAALGEPQSVYSYLDHRLSRPWSKQGLGVVDMVREYAEVKKELEKKDQEAFRPCSSGFEQVEDAA